MTSRHASASRHRRSTAATAAFLPANVDGAGIVRYLRDTMHVTFAGGQDQLKGKIVRIAHLGYAGAFDVVTALAALELALAYARERIQFGKPLAAFPRVAGKIAWMAVETMIARQLAYFAARQKDSDRRCDIEAGMAKLLAARTAWSNADNAVQIHGGNGYAEEFPISRVLCDARILNIFEGTAEIQSNIIARGLIGGRN